MGPRELCRVSYYMCLTSFTVDSYFCVPDEQFREHSLAHFVPDSYICLLVLVSASESHLSAVCSKLYCKNGLPNVQD